MKRIKANIIFTEPCLGTASADPELHSRFIASKGSLHQTHPMHSQGRKRSRSWVSRNTKKSP